MTAQSHLSSMVMQMLTPDFKNEVHTMHLLFCTGQNTGLLEESHFTCRFPFS